MKRAANFLVCLLSVIIVLFLFFWSLYVYPDDTRISGFNGLSQIVGESHSLRKDSWIIKKRFFIDHLTYRVSVSDDEYKRLFSDIQSFLPVESQTFSTRFHDSKQLYLPIGLYPYRLDGRDGIYLPSGASISVRPGIDEPLKVQLGLWSLGSDATLELSGTTRSFVHKIEYKQPSASIDIGSPWFRAFWKWLHVDLKVGEDFAGWSDGEAYFELKDSSEIVFTCRTLGQGCFLSEPIFSVKDDAQKKNFIVILVDTLRRDAIKSDVTPHMHEFAQKSINFAHAVAPGNMTSPSTNALLSCRSPTSLGGWAFAYGVSQGERNEIYRKSLKSFPERFLRAGYLTTMIGSVSVISELYGVGIHHGFNRQIAVETDGFDTAQITREAQKWLVDNSSQRFFLYVHLNAPHAPYKAPWRDVFGTWPGFGVFRSYSNILRWLYTSEARYTDRYLKHILKTVDDLGLGSNTAVILLADHGDQMSVRKFSGNEVGPEFVGSYFDHGATLLDDEIGVPFIIYDPQLKSGGIVHDWVSTLDLGPTLMEMAGIPSDGICEGKSLGPYLNGNSSRELVSRTLVSEGFQGRAIIFENRYKYIRSYEPTQKRVHFPGSYFSEPTLYFSREQLYNLREDPSEERNLASIDLVLLEKARSLYKDVFKVKDGWELVIESPDAADIIGQFPPATRIQLSQGEASLSRENGLIYLHSRGQKTLIMQITNWDPKMSWLRIGDLQVPIRRTSLRLPVNTEIASLPIESGGQESLLPFPREPSAYIRRVEDSGREERKIRVTNPAFESVLREWGYLNDR